MHESTTKNKRLNDQSFPVSRAYNKSNIMKKKYFLLSLSILISSILCTNYGAYAQCTAKSVIQNCKTHIVNPYKYNGYWMSEFTFEQKVKKIEGHFVAFEGEKYHILFCSSGFEEVITICVYDKSSRTDKNRKKLYDSSESKEKNYWTFEATKSGDYFIEYTIPPSKNGQTKKSCVVLIIGAVIDTGTK